MAHGTGKLFQFPPVEQFADRPGADDVAVVRRRARTGRRRVAGGWASFTRIVAFVLSGEMAVAYWMAHAPRAFYPIQNGGELADHVLLRVSLHRRRRRRAVEPRPRAVQQEGLSRYSRWRSMHWVRARVMRGSIRPVSRKRASAASYSSYVSVRVILSQVQVQTALSRRARHVEALARALRIRIGRALAARRQHRRAHKGRQSPTHRLAPAPGKVLPRHEV